MSRFMLGWYPCHVWMVDGNLNTKRVLALLIVWQLISNVVTLEFTSLLVYCGLDI